MENTTGSIGTITNDYFTNQIRLDECFGLEGDVKQYWKRLLANVETLGPTELKNREIELLKLLQENGVTYNVYGDPSGLNRPWVLDAIPLLISAVDWRVMDRGMKQRAFVLNKMLEDLYGERKLLKEGIIPPELIYAHSGFLRPCDQIKLPGPNQLIFYAADLSRGPDDKVWLLRDRTQAPSGMGYALENRSAMGRVLPELFKDHNVSKLGGFFNNMMQSFRDIAPQGKAQPRVVLLTPGPRNETYFEHAFLSSYLGFTLVQGEDLVVRNGFVWIKTVEGLEKVDVILRRVDDSFCDPLELREESQLGVPGLLESIRKGNVAIANPLGSSILENAGLMAFHHNVCRYFLNEDPIFQMMATWWCGQKKEMDYVIANIDKLVVKKMDRAQGSDTVIGRTLSKAQRESTINKIKAQPYLYVGQEEVDFSTSPVFQNGKLEPRYSVLRTFMVASKGGYEIMPGGLTRCSSEKGGFHVSNQDGGISKDTWLEIPVKNSVPVVTGTSDLKGKSVLPSRAAENLFWVGRYSQRVLRTSRFIRIVLRNLSQTGYLSEGVESEGQKVLLKTITHLTSSYPGFLEDDEESLSIVDDHLAEIHQLICNPDQNGGIAFTVNSLLKAMYAVRDRWPIDNWRIIDDIETVKRRLALVEPQGIRHVFSLLDRLNGSLLSFLEMNRQSMYRGEGWIMYRIGQLIEELTLELTQYRSLLTFQYEESEEFYVLEALLISNQNLSSYRSVYRTYFDMAPVLDLLFFNKQNPTSILSQLEQLQKFVEQLPRSAATASNDIANIVFECYSQARLASVEKFLQIDSEANFRPELDAYCSEMMDKISSLSTKLTANYFSHTIYQYQGLQDGFGLKV
ncbi:circularly permuted type 2 ATP-grasp protein [soil metagenome]